jgi:hypothetical protein
VSHGEHRSKILQFVPVKRLNNGTHFHHAGLSSGLPNLSARAWRQTRTMGTAQQHTANKSEEHGLTQTLVEASRLQP